MVNSAFNFVPHPRNLGFEHRNPGLQLFHGKRVQILFDQQTQRIIRATREEFVHIHGFRVARCRHAVNGEA